MARSSLTSSLVSICICSIDFTARSNATQAITFEWVKCCRGPRTSQIPSSGCFHASSRNVTSAVAMFRVLRSGVMPSLRVTCNVSATSPATSSWNCADAAFPVRTGREPS